MELEESGKRRAESMEDDRFATMMLSFRRAERMTCADGIENMVYGWGLIACVYSLSWWCIRHFTVLFLVPESDVGTYMLHNSALLAPTVAYRLYSNE